MSAVQLVGAPYAREGEGPSAFNCWALVRRALMLERGIEVPQMRLDIEEGWRAVNLRKQMAATWSIVSGPARRCDILAMVGAHRELHVGMFLDASRVLHTSADAGEARIQRFEDFRFLGFGRFETWRLSA